MDLRHESLQTREESEFELSLTRAVLVVVGLALLISLGTSALAGDSLIRLATDHAAPLLAVGVGWLLLHRGWVRTAGVMVLFTCFVAVSLAGLQGAGIFGITLSLFAPVVVVATLLYGRQGALISVLASWVVISLFYAGAESTPPSSEDALGRSMVVVTMLVSVGAVVALAHARMWRAVREAVAGRALAQELAQTLERRVEERTAELVAQHQELMEEQAERSRLEIELRHSQKLSAVGRLAAGIAHEINSPIQYVGDSLHFLREADKDLWRVLEAALALIDQAEEGVDPEARRALQALVEEADLDFLEEALPEAHERSEGGIRRVADIVRAMRGFAHPDRDAPEVVDLDEVVSQALVVCAHQYRHFADVEVETDGLAPVPGFRGDLGQVMLNLLVNASQAIEEVVADRGGRGTIRVRTWEDGPWAVISVSDDGPGIPEELRERIFEPFFTTKEVGKGTGQGLAVCYHVVVDRHHGRIDLETTPGEGTTFHVRLPRPEAGG